MRLKNGKRAARFGLALLLSGLFALVVYRFNTPLGPSIGSDNAMYLTMGTALARGYAPYTDIFDHKGPLLLLIEMLPQLFFGGYQTATVFAMEWAALLGCLLLLDAICGEIGLRRAWPVQLVYLALFAPCAGGGNLSEEYVSVATLAGLLLIVRAFDGGGKRFFAPAMGVGALAMAAFLTRANNALPLAGASAGLSLCLALRGEWKTLGACALGVLAGCAAAAVPVALWLVCEGALGDAVYGAITHNLLYTGAQGASRLGTLLHTGYGRLAMTMAGVSAAGAAACFWRTRKAAVPMALLFGAALAGVAGFLSHKFYQHYLTLGVPLAAVGAAQLLFTLEKRRPAALRAAQILLACACCLCLCVCGYRANGERLAERADLPQFTQDAQALYALVPEEERDSFMAYRVEPRWYVAARALPCMRFYFLQEILAQVDPRVMDEIVETFETRPPRWLVLYHDREFSPPYDPRVQAIFETRYEFVDARGGYQLLRFKEAV